MEKQGDPPARDDGPKEKYAARAAAVDPQPTGKCYTQDGDYVGEMTEGQCELKAPGGTWVRNKGHD